MKAVTETFAAADIKDVSALLDGRCQDQEKSFILGGVIAAVSELASEGVTRTFFTGTPDEFIRFCQSYGETGNSILAIRRAFDSLLEDVSRAADAGMEKCGPDMKFFNILCPDNGNKELAVMWFRKANC